MRLTESEKKWVNKKWALIRQAQQRADEQNNDWLRLNEEINDYLKRSGITDVVQIAKVKSENLGLLEALGAGSWHAANAQRHIDDVQLFLRLRELEIL